MNILDVLDKYEERNRLLEQAYWFAKHKMVDTAISCVEEAFNNFVEFRAWYLTEGMDDERQFSENFIKWVAKIMIVFYDGHCTKNDQELVDITIYETLDITKKEDAENAENNM